MRRYETFSILDPDLSEEGRAPVIDKVKEVITSHDGFLVQVDDWGNRKLAYEIKKKARGYYVRFDFCGDGTLIDEMERFFRINDNVMKFMTVLLDEEVDLEKVKEEVAAMEAEKAQREEAAKETSSESETTDVAGSKATKAEVETPDAAESEASEAGDEPPEAADSKAAEAKIETVDAADSKAPEDEAKPTPEESQEQTPVETDEEKK